MQILVLGMHRSGTSALARLLNMTGVYFGPEGISIPPAADNPKGHWERRDVVKINASLLQRQGCKWYDLAGWRFSEAHNVPEETQQAMRQLLYGMDANRPWFIKDPRLCLTLPAWRAQLEAPIAVIIYRDPREVALSLQSRSQLPLDYGIALWEYHAAGLLNASRSMPRLFVSHAEMMERPGRVCQVLVEALRALGARRIALPSIQEIRAFIDPALYHARLPAEHVPQLSTHQQLICEVLQGAREQDDTLQVSQASHTIMQAGLAQP